MTKVKILYCPQFEPFQPYLAPGYLKALLKVYDVESSYFDLNIDFYRWLFKQKDRIKSNTKRTKYILENLDYAISYIDNEFKDILKYKWAINVIESYLALISPKGFKISLSSLTIGNKYSSDDLQKFVYSDSGIYNDYFESIKDRIFKNRGVNTFLFSITVLDQLGPSLFFSRKIKELFPHVKIYFGGPTITRFYKRLKNIKWIYEIADSLEVEEGYKSLAKIFNIKNIYTGHVTPDYSDYDFKQYLSPKIVLPYLASHGCKWGKCVFCSHHLSYEGYRTSSISEVVKDFIFIKRSYGVEYISFCDEYLTPEQLGELSSLLLNHKADIRWSTFVRAEKKFTEESFTKGLYESGSRLLFFGFETTSQRLLRLMKKGNNSEHYKPILKSCANSNISVRIDIMFGFPTETNEEAYDTINFILENKDIVDTPFSSYPVAIFELREDIPLFYDLDKYNISVKGLSRGDLDEQYDFRCKGELSSEQKANFRESLIREMKSNMLAELITPYNKTHQLIAKDFFDKKKLNIPKEENISLDLEKCIPNFEQGVEVTYTSEKILLENFSNNGKIELNFSIKNIIELIKTNENDSLFSIYQKTNLPLSTFKKLCNYLYRSSFVSLN